MRRELVWIGLSAGLLSALSVLAYGCGQTSSGSCADNGTCPASLVEGGADAEADGGADAVADTGADAVADAGDGSDAYPCDPTKTPSEDSCVVGNMYGVFVSPSGHDGAAGNMGDPFLKVADAIVAATGHTDRVLACAGSYDEALTLGSSPGADAGSEDGGSFAGGVTVFGGLDCAHGWAYTGARAVLAPTTPGTALTVKGLTVGVTFEDFGFQALAGTNPGDSSIAVFASQSAGLTLVRCELVAGAGQPGQDQVAVMGFDAGAPGGDPGTANNGGGRTPNACGGVAMASVGGAGGLPGATGNDGQDGTPGASNNGTSVGCSSSAGLGGGAGADGAPGSAGAGAASWAAFDQNGWIPANGAAGGGGGVGQGGGGGASVDTTGGGGGGGAGGCGGVAGAAGTGGGSSIALLVYQATVDLENCTITVADAARGGNGAPGQVGQLGGGHGNGFGGSACSGGKGGNGGNGGGGGGGAGGLSVGVLWTGTSPTIDGSPVGQASPLDAGPDAGTLAQVTLGAPGAAGTGGTASGSADAGAGGDGIPGVVAAVLQFQ
jgi:hypothetical protein